MIQSMRMCVAVIRGGIGDEHDVSLRSGAAVLEYLRSREDAYQALDVFIDRTGQWFVRGKAQKPEDALSCIDVVWIALHGTYGEDGTVQRLLERIGVPYTGSGPLSSAIAMNKELSKQEVQKEGILTPRSVTISVSPHLDEEIASLFRTFPQPSVIKPLCSGSSVGVHIAHSFTDFKNGIHDAFNHSSKVLIEEYIKGKEATVGVVDNFRGSIHYALPTVEIVPKKERAFFDYEAKYGGETTENCPGNFSSEETKKLQQAAVLAHKALGMRHYSRSDFMVSSKGVYYLETNSLPGMTKESLLPKALLAVGTSFGGFIDHVISLACKRV